MRDVIWAVLAAVLTAAIIIGLAALWLEWEVIQRGTGF